jgi:large subunit ribosomal protein L18
MSNLQKLKIQQRTLRRGRVRSRVSGTADRPRLAVFRSNSHMYAQLIDDTVGKTLAHVSSQGLKATGTKTDIALELGKSIAAKALAAKIEAVVFDRGGFRYHGRVKAVAEGARAGGLTF